VTEEEKRKADVEAGVAVELADVRDLRDLFVLEKLQNQPLFGKT